MSNVEREIPIDDLASDVEIIMRTLKVPIRKLYLVPNVSVQFVSDDFGVVVNVINRVDYTSIKKVVHEKLPGYRYIYISTFDNLIEAKEEIIWTLMQSGYMKYVRQNFTRTFNSLIVQQDFGNKIINERLKRWGNVPKYNFFVEENIRARQMPATMILSTEPAFFDYMP